MRIDPEYNLFRSGWWLGSIDSRPVAVFRAFYGALLLKDALFHVPLARLLYSDQGILPRSALLSPPPGPFRFSLMDAVGPPSLVVAFFLVWALVAASLMLGYRTRLAALLNYLIVVSVQYRNGYVLDGSDAVFRVLGFWAIFLPLGDHYGLDSLSRRLRARVAGAPEPAPPGAWALPLRMAQLQVAIIYLVTAAEKLRSGAWLSGDALFYTMQLKTLTLPLADALFEATPPMLLRVGGVGVLLVEWALPFLLLSPIGQPVLRLLGLGLGVLLHAGIAATMSIPNFSLLMITSYWLFARGEWVEAIARRLRSAREPAELALPEPRAPIWPWLLCARGLTLSPPAMAYAEVDTWWIRTGGGGEETGRAAWSRLAGYVAPTRFWRPLLGLARVRLLSWRAGEAYVQRAGRLGIPAPAAPARARRAVLGAALAFVMASLVWHNAWAVYYPLVPPPRGPALNAVLYLALWQRWNMFLAGGQRADGWVEVAGVHEDGRVLDLFRGGPPSQELPRRHAGPWTRWTSLERVVEALPPAHLSAWAWSACRASTAPGRRLVHVELRHHFRVPHAPGKARAPLQTRVLWRQSCLAGAPGFRP